MEGGVGRRGEDGLLRGRGLLGGRGEEATVGEEGRKGGLGWGWWREGGWGGLGRRARGEVGAGVGHYYINVALFLQSII